MIRRRRGVWALCDGPGALLLLFSTPLLFFFSLLLFPLLPSSSSLFFLHSSLFSFSWYFLFFFSRISIKHRKKRLIWSFWVFGNWLCLAVVCEVKSAERGGRPRVPELSCGNEPDAKNTAVVLPARARAVATYETSGAGTPRQRNSRNRHETARFVPGAAGRPSREKKFRSSSSARLV